MNKFKFFVFLALAGLLDAITSRFAGIKNPVPMANELAVGTHNKPVTYQTDSAVTTRNLIGKMGSDSSHIAICGAADIPLGVMTDEAPAAGSPIAVDLFGVNPKTKIVVASGVIAAGVEVVPADGGKVRALPAAAGTYRVIGIAFKGSSADGEEIEIIPSYPNPRIVT